MPTLGRWKGLGGQVGPQRAKCWMHFLQGNNQTIDFKIEFDSFIFILFDSPFGYSLKSSVNIKINLIFGFALRWNY